MAEEYSNLNGNYNFDFLDNYISSVLNPVANPQPELSSGPDEDETDYGQLEEYNEPQRDSENTESSDAPRDMVDPITAMLLGDDSDENYSASPSAASYAGTALSSGKATTARRSGSGAFQQFDTPEEGQAALENQLNIYKTGRSRNPVRPDSSLYQAMAVYAPASDNNHPKQYAEFIANKLGISPDTPISKIDTKKWAAAIKVMEGNKGNNPGNLKRVKQAGGYDDISQQGYSDDSPYRGEDSLLINTPTGDIDMTHTSMSLIGQDETGHTKVMHPGGKYKFPGNKVKETPIKKHK